MDAQNRSKNMTKVVPAEKKRTGLWFVFSTAVMVALICYAAYILVGLNSDVLITAQDRNPFSGDSLYFSQEISRPFGLFQYIGGFLTQLFFHPAVGTCLLIVIWLASAFAGIKAFRLKGIWRSLTIVPAACLLASEVDLGYWVYCNTLPGYWYSQSVAYLCLMLLLWAANATPRKFRIVWYVVIGFICFPVFGWISYLFTVCFALTQFKRDDKGRTTATWVDGVGFAITVAAISVFRLLLYDKIPVDDVYLAGFPYFKTATNVTPHLSYPFYILIATTIFMSLGSVLPTLKKVPACIAYLIVGGVSSWAVWTAMFKDKNYLYEMKMTQATMVDDWQSVINVAEQTKTPSRAMVMLKNVALLNTGQLSHSYELGNSGVEINNPDTLNINIMHIAAPLIYYNHGKINYAMRWCIEFAVPYGFSPYYLKVLARSAEATGEKALAQRYISRLHGLLYYKDWQPAHITPIVKELKDVYPDSLSNDENSVERYLIKNFDEEHYAKSKYHCELSMLYSTIIRDPHNFWISLYNYMLTHKGQQLPAQYEEAYCVFNEQAPVKFPLKVDITPVISQKYKQFWDSGNSMAESGMSEDAVREAMRGEWGSTYWWFNAFGRMEY